MSPRFQQPVYSLAHFRALFPAKVEAALRPWANSRYKISKRKTKLVMLWLIFCSWRCYWLINSRPLPQPVLGWSGTTPSCESFSSSPLLCWSLQHIFPEFWLIVVFIVVLYVMHFKTCLLSTGTCNFDGGFCEWINLPLGDEFDWTLNSGKTGTMLTGPTEDHTGYQGMKCLNYA